MTCPECGQNFSAERRPRMLPCGHTFCTPCLIHLHEQNSAVIPCTTCGGEIYCEDVSEIPVNLWVESHMASLTLQADAKSTATKSDKENKESPWNTCSTHNSPMAFWCRTCSTAVCNRCTQEHRSKSHQVFNFQETRQLLLSQYENRSQAFLEWLVKVKKVTQQTLNATESMVPVLTHTLSTIEEYTQRMKREKQSIEDAPSLETMESLLDKTSSWHKSSEASLQHQVEKILGLFQQAQSHLHELEDINEEMKEQLGITKPVKDRPTAMPSSTAPGNVTSMEVSNLIVRARSPLPRQLGRGFSDVEAVTLPGEVSVPFSTQVEIRATGDNARCGVLYKAADDALLLCLWCRFHDDLVRTCSFHPITRHRSPDTEQRGCGLRKGHIMWMTIIEQPNHYEIRLDGQYLLSKKKFKHYENTTLCRKIKIHEKGVVKNKLLDCSSVDLVIHMWIYFCTVVFFGSKYSNMLPKWILCSIM